MTSPDRFRRIQRIAVAAALMGALSVAGGKGNTPPPPPLAVPGTDIQVFGVWHCGNHYCDWSEPVDMAAFERDNHWLIDRGDASHTPAVNLVVLSFVHPLKLLDGIDTATRLPVGMTREVVEYFTGRGVRVMLSIGGITYTDAWDAALSMDPWQLGLNAAAVARDLGVGIEIDYENSSSPNLDALEEFIRAYRSKIEFDATGNDPAARLTIDVAAGDRWLIALNRRATEKWLRPDSLPAVKLDYANAMVSGTASGTPTEWQEHVDGKPQYVPKVPPLLPARFTGGLYLKGNTANCLNYATSEQKADAAYVKGVMPNEGAFPTTGGYTPGMLGYMFWAAGTPSARKAYVPTTNCTGGMGVAAQTFGVPVPMEPLRQK